MSLKAVLSFGFDTEANSVLRVLKGWVDRYLSNEEALLLVVLITALLLVVVTMGGVLAPFLAAIVLAYLLQGSVQGLKQKGASHLLATVIVFLAFVGGFLALMLIVLPASWAQLSQFVVELPKLASQGQELLMLLPEQYPDLINQQQVKEWTDEIRSELASVGQLALGFSISGLTVAMTVLVYCVLVPILVFFLLKDSDAISEWCVSFLPQRRDLLNTVWTEMNAQIANYVRGKALEIVVVAAATYIGFLWMGLNYAALLAIAVGLSVLVPYIGAAVVTLPVALVAYLQWGWGNDFIYLMVLYGIIQALDGNVLVPLLFSEVVNLHPVAIIVAVLVFGGLWGFWGVFFAIPLATLLKAVIQAWPRHEQASSD